MRFVTMVAQPRQNDRSYVHGFALNSYLQQHEHGGRAKTEVSITVRLLNIRVFIYLFIYSFIHSWFTSQRLQ